MLPGVLMTLAGIVCASAQTTEWRHIGNAAIDLGLASVSTGPVARVWYAPTGDRLFAATASGRTYSTSDFEQWQPAADVTAPPQSQASAPALPEPGARVREATTEAGRLYAFHTQAWRSDDGGSHWIGLTGYRGSSLIGADLTDLAVSPRDADEITVASATGVWRSVDAGASWSGLNQFLPNLPAFRIMATPSGTHGLRIGLNAALRDLEWAPGEKTAWKPLVQPSALAAEAEVRRNLSQSLRTTITAIGASGDYLYAGGSDGRLWSSSDGARTWRVSGSADESGAITAIFVDPKDPRIAIASSGSKPAAAHPLHVRKTMNGGAFWDDGTANLPDVSVNGVTADHAAGAIYLATDAGVYSTSTDLTAAGAPSSWQRVAEELPAVPVADVKLDTAGNQLYVAVDGYGVYASLAPHRLRDPQVVSAADYMARAAAPGSLLTVLGAHVTQANSANAPIPVLAATATESQIQVPFDASGDTLSLAMTAGEGATVDRTVPLQPAAPAIFVDGEGAPLVLDADSGLMLDAMHPAHSRARIQILATGLGRVTPDWPAGVAAPAQNPPKVNAQVRVLIDRQPVDVTRAVLAPGYVGFYLVEIEVPGVVNAGPSELYIETGTQASNRVRVYIEP